jgi:prepilin-type N-terminal cleavage/methylation domain-containing protein
VMRLLRPTSRRTARSRAARAGFTLVEVLLVLLIMGGIMLSMTQILTAARTSRDTIHNIQETQNAGPAILDMVERDLRGISVYDRTRQNHLRVKNRVMLGFDADSLDFVTTTDSLVLHEDNERFVRSDANEVGYRLRPNPDNDQFLEIYRREGYGVDDNPFEGGNFLYLHDRVKGLDIQCFRKDGPDEQPVDEWGAQEHSEDIGLPARIEITLTLELAPRLVNEQMLVAPVDRRTVIYKRVIRFPELLRPDEDKIPVPTIPQVPSGSGAGGKPGAPGAAPMGVAGLGRRGGGGGGQGAPGSGGSRSGGGGGRGGGSGGGGSPPH